MSVITIAGPFHKDAAEETAKALGANCSVYGIERKDGEGYGTGEFEYWVERDDTLPSGLIFGYPANELMARQYKRG